MITSKTALYGILGNPVGHSLSPQMHNIGFRYHNLNAVYVAFEVKLEDLEFSLNGCRGLGIKGLSVTIPYKEKVIKYLDTLDEHAKKIGAVNTILNEAGKLTGYNTDGLGAYEAIVSREDISGKSIFIIGNGGTAKAIVHALVSKVMGIDIMVCGRSRKKLEVFIKDVKKSYPEARLSFCTYEDEGVDILVTRSKVIINTTPIGMAGYDAGYDIKENIPLPLEQVLTKEHILFDVVYKPLETNFLRIGKAKGAVIINGLELLLNQGILQFELWTGLKAPKEKMYKALYENISI